MKGDSGVDGESYLLGSLQKTTHTIENGFGIGLFTLPGLTEAQRIC